MCARQVSGVFETRWFFVARSCSGGVDGTELSPGIAGSFSKALAFRAFFWNRLLLDERSIKNRPRIANALKRSQPVAAELSARF
jgi:hypothetical protein